MSQNATQPQQNTSNGLDSLIKQVQALPEGPQKQSMMIALGLAKANPFKVVEKLNEKTQKAYRVIAIDGAKVQFSGKTGKVILDHLDYFAEAVAEALK